MVPFPMLQTESSAERLLYEAFLEQLDDEYVVFHSVDWVLADRRGRPEQGEADFVVAHPEDGVLVIEVKGGEVRYESDTFSAPYSWGHLPLGQTMLPREEWAPGMDEALDALRAEIAADGWVTDGRGEQEWQDHYRLAG